MQMSRRPVGTTVTPDIRAQQKGLQTVLRSLAISARILGSEVTLPCADGAQKDDLGPPALPRQKPRRWTLCAHLGQRIVC
jgi:hypothetical protein